MDLLNDDAALTDARRTAEKIRDIKHTHISSEDPKHYSYDRRGSSLAAPSGSRSQAEFTFSQYQPSAAPAAAVRKPSLTPSSSITPGPRRSSIASGGARTPQQQQVVGVDDFDEDPFGPPRARQQEQRSREPQRTPAAAVSTTQSAAVFDLDPFEEPGEAVARDSPFPSSSSSSRPQQQQQQQPFGGRGGAAQPVDFWATEAFQQPSRPAVRTVEELYGEEELDLLTEPTMTRATAAAAAREDEDPAIRNAAFLVDALVIQDGDRKKSRQQRDGFDLEEDDLFFAESKTDPRPQGPEKDLWQLNDLANVDDLFATKAKDEPKRINQGQTMAELAQKSAHNHHHHHRAAQNHHVSPFSHHQSDPFDSDPFAPPEQQHHAAHTPDPFFF